LPDAALFRSGMNKVWFAGGATREALAAAGAAAGDAIKKNIDKVYKKLKEK